ncbi:DUF4123 domain-containing protein, partial [Glaciimonas sp. CA11.2]
IEMWKKSRSENSDVVSLYDKTVLSELEECAPFLIAITAMNLSGVLKNCEGKPMLSIMQSPLTIHALQRHFAPFLQIRTPSDGLCFSLPFSDTICSEDILYSFDAAQRKAFCSGFAKWHLINRKGTLTTIDGTCIDTASYVPSAVGESNAFDITDKQYAWLIDSGEADYILRHFAQNIPAITAQRKPSQLYAMITDLITGLNRREILNDPERRKLIAHALVMPDREQAMALLDEAQKHGTEIALLRFA